MRTGSWRASQGGVLIPPGIDPEDLDTLALRPQKVAVVYKCPMCGNQERTNIAGIEPCCTGPHPSLDEHPMIPMVRVET